MNRYRNSKSNDERSTALRSLGRAKDPELIKRTLHLIFSGEVKDQDIYLPISGLRSHPAGIQALFTWMTENWNELTNRLPPGLTMLGSVVSLCTSAFNSEEDLNRIQSFFSQRSTKGFDLALAQSCDNIRSKSSWLARDREDVKKWITSYVEKLPKSSL